jgi:hypothetical protein
MAVGLTAYTCDGFLRRLTHLFQKRCGIRWKIMLNRDKVRTRKDAVTSCFKTQPQERDYRMNMSPNTLVWIRTEHFPNKNFDRFRYTNKFGESLFSVTARVTHEWVF